MSNIYTAHKEYMEPKIMEYEFCYTGRHITDGYHLNRDATIEAYSLDEARLRLKRDFIHIDIQFEGVAYSRQDEVQKG